MVLENWEYDPSSLDLLNYYRISSNAVYPFMYNGQVRILRFCPCNEKDKSNIIGELEFIRYLYSKGYPALHTVKSKNNQELLQVHTPWGDYFAFVFERVAGIQLGETDYTCDICRKHGKYLGRLHKLSSEYKPPNTMRHSYEDVLIWAERELLNFNIFYDNTADTLNIIDFDDAMYHWYIMDICQALDSIMNDGCCADFSSMNACFFEGYREEFDVSDDIVAN
ncbi:phosphotransferase enzyme family protein [Pseudobacteroides cellulosolvens]|uniref:Aminoglycoside phosphotransferase n=1 Tax=Pseudobacteroides cellulosolvens ATCC 35603 = DSM 2933 TaxID=398512 RepID=A0A0L6JVE3_9FIRM|nr:phosphotransferase [Pseudobacteroides cellulosolvens]KNY29615.1 hypothetical protein Bccel_4889 [Pseudobacteroides cellulosolvens ATCC 35603 = DSM 2933]